MPYTNADEAAALQRQGWYAVLVLGIAYIFSYMDRQLLTLLIEPIKTHLHISDTQVSLISGLAFALCYSLFALPLGRLADTVSRRNVIAFGVCAWSVMTGACGLAQSFIQLFIARMGVGIGEAALIPSAYSMIADYFPPRRLALAMGLFVLGAPLGAGLALIAGGSVVDLVGRFPPIRVGHEFLRPWQAAFLIIGGAGLLVALTALTVKEPERKSLPRSVISESNDGFSVAEVFQFLRRRAGFLALLIGGLALINIFNYGVLAWMATLFIRIHGWSLPQTGIAIGFELLTFGCLGPVAGGLLVNEFMRRGHHDACLRGILFSVVLLLPSSVVMALASSATTAIIFVAPVIFGIFLMAGIFPTLIQIITPNRMRGQVSAVYLFIVNMAGLGLGPTAYAFATDYIFKSDRLLNYSLASVSVLLLTAGGALIACAIKPYSRAVAEARG